MRPCHSVCSTVWRTTHPRRSSSLYSWRTLKPLLRGGSPPPGAITTRFTRMNGVLEFVNASLPGGQATFCQDSNTREVLLNFASSPPNCEPAVIVVYGGKLHQELILCYMRLNRNNSRAMPEQTDCLRGRPQHSWHLFHSTRHWPFLQPVGHAYFKSSHNISVTACHPIWRQSDRHGSIFHSRKQFGIANLISHSELRNAVRPASIDFVRTFARH